MKDEGEELDSASGFQTSLNSPVSGPLIALTTQIKYPDVFPIHLTARCIHSTNIY